MEVKYTKQEISTEICEDGGATGRIVGNQVLPLGTAVEEAISGNYTIGDKTLLVSEITGLIRSMVENSSKDGNARQIDGLFTVTPCYYGLIDPEKGHDPAVNGVELKIRLLKELRIDTSGWTFVDVTPGKEPIKAQTVSTGDTSGEIVPGATAVIKVTGYGLENVSGVDWAVPEALQSGTFAANKITKSATVVTIADGLASLNVPANDGRKIILTVRGEKNCSKVTGVLRYEAVPTITKVATPGKEGVQKGAGFEIDGTNLATPSSSKVKWTEGSEQKEQTLTPTSTTATKLTFAAVSAFDAVPVGTTLTFEVVVNGKTATKTATLLAAALLNVTFDAMTAKLSGAGQGCHLTISNAEGLTGYSASDLALQATVNGGTPETIHFARQGATDEYVCTSLPDCEEGDTLAVTGTVDETKTAYAPGTPTKSCVVEA